MASPLPPTTISSISPTSATAGAFQFRAKKLLTNLCPSGLFQRTKPTESRGKINYLGFETGLQNLHSWVRIPPAPPTPASRRFPRFPFPPCATASKLLPNGSVHREIIGP